MNELSKSLRCIVMRNGIEIWVEDEKAEIFQKVLLDLKEHKFVKFGSRTINTADATGIFTAQDMEEHTRRKNGEWKCENNVWHQRNEKCDCSKIKYLGARDI